MVCGCGINGSICCFFFSCAGTVILFVLSAALHFTSHRVGEVESGPETARTTFIAGLVYIVFAALSAVNYWFEAKVRKPKAAVKADTSRSAERLVTWE